MICVSSITYCIKIDWDFYQLLITFYDERATSSGGFFVQNSFPLPLREVCVSMKLSFQYKREKRVVFCVHEVERQVKPVSVNETSIKLPVFNYKNVFQNCEQAQFWKKNKAMYYKRDMRKVSIKKLKIVKNRVKQRHFYWFSWRYTVAGAM